MLVKCILTIEKIVECESSQRAIELARSDLCESDWYSTANWHSYELTPQDMFNDHNKQLGIIK